MPVRDIGIDAFVEIISEGMPTGDWFALQVKSGDSYFREKTPDGFVYRGDTAHLEYWLNLPFPIFLILCLPDQDRCWWQPIDPQYIKHTGKGWKTNVPLTNKLGKQSAESICEFIETWPTDRHVRRLPAEDELSIIFQWLGRCKLIHKLHQFIYPPGALSQFKVPDILAAFEVKGVTVPVCQSAFKFDPLPASKIDPQ